MAVADTTQRELSYRKRLIDIANGINSAPGIPEILVDLKDRMLDLVDAERVTIFALDTRNQELFSLFKAGQEVRLTRKEFDLLRYLVEHRGEVVTRDRLLDEVWGYEQFPTTRTVDTHILRLRQKFEKDPEHPAWILTVHGQGYKFAG